MKIGIDIDEVVVSFLEGFLEIYNKKYNTNISVDEIISYNLWECLPITKEESISIGDEFHDSEHFEGMGLVEGAVESIKKLSTNHEIIFVTSRPLNIKSKTENFIQKHFPKIPVKIFFSGDFYGKGLTKSQICSDQGIDFLVEDNKHYAFDCAKNGINVFLLDKPWNKDYEEHVNLTKVNNWNEILENLR